MGQTYTGGCHCGAVRFSATADLATVIECNCSHCSRKGLLLAFTPHENFTLEQGEGSLTEYRFNKRVIAHQFCKVCALNVRCFDGVDLTTLKRTPYDGASK